MSHKTCINVIIGCRFTTAHVAAMTIDQVNVSKVMKGIIMNTIELFGINALLSYSHVERQSLIFRRNYYILSG